MEYRSTEINADKPLSLNLPKCGPERNAIESFDIASNKNEEEKVLKNSGNSSIWTWTWMEEVKRRKPGAYW